MQQNFRVKGKKLYLGFVDLEKAFDRVPTEVGKVGSGRMAGISSHVYVYMCKNSCQNSLW